MEFLKFRIKNFKGIEDIKIDLSRRKGNVFTLVGLNESGKTTVLEAISYLMEASDKEKHRPFFGNSFNFLDNPVSLIPISKFADFNGTISIDAILSFSDEEKNAVINHLRTRFPENDFRINAKDFYIQKSINFKFSQVAEDGIKYNWYVGLECRKIGRGTKFKNNDNKEYWNEFVNYVKENLLPHIVFFPTFLFDFPKEIFLDADGLHGIEKTVNDYYKDILQDILYSMNPEAKLEEHIYNRLKTGSDDEKRMAESMLKRMGIVFSDKFFQQWNEIFNHKKELSKRKITIAHGVKEQKIYLSFKIEEGEDEFYVSERSMGFRWFFSFILFTEIRSLRKDGSKILFLLDEPASNLHSYAQHKILESFAKTIKNGNRIMFSTHSHHLINPNWLEDAFICKNEFIDYDNQESLEKYSNKQAKITLIPYKQFVAHHPEQTTFFQPILDALAYVPSKLEYIPDAIIMEGKTDHYIINYFKNIIFGKKFDKFAIIPGIGGSDSLDPVIRLYLGWGRGFLVMLDGDDAGKASAEKYRADFMLSDKQVQILSDIDKSFIKIESLVSKKDKDKYNLKKKKDICLFFMEILARNQVVELSDETKSNFENLLSYFDKYFSK